MDSKIDVRTANEGTVILFTLVTKTAQDWVTVNIGLEPWQWMGRNSFAVDYRHAVPLVYGMKADGLVVA